jgi:hypothetical protein
MINIARRSLYKVHYSPIQPSPEDERAGRPEMRNRGLEKIAFASALRATEREVAVVKRSLTASDPQGTEAALDALGGLLNGAARANKRIIARTPYAALIGAGRALARYRRQQRATFRKIAGKLTKDYGTFVREMLEAVAAPHLQRPSATNESGAAPPRLASPSESLSASTAALRRAIVTERRSLEQDPRLSAASLKPTFAAALDWARVRDPTHADQLASLARDIAGIRLDTPDLLPVIWDKVTESVATLTVVQPDSTELVIDAFEERMKVEPIGRLHLERIDMSPTAILRGELMHSIGMAPKETVVLIHREWSSRTTTFEKVVAEEFEQSKEDSVTENTELANATETQSRHSSSLSMEATASGSYGFASGSVTVGYEATSEDETAQRVSRNHSVEVTSKAASRTRKEHKVTFTVKEEAGVEDQSVRTITNPSETDPMRVDFHQMLRKWKVDLYRYGLRLTYDIVVPGPGNDLLAKVAEIRQIEHVLGQPLKFSVKPEEITLKNWTSLAAEYSADVDPPDPEELVLFQSLTLPERTLEESKTDRLDVLPFDVPAGYYVNRGEFHGYISFYQQENGSFDVLNDIPPEMKETQQGVHFYESGLELLTGRIGRTEVVMRSYAVKSGYVQASLTVAQTEDAWQAWQTRAWSALRNGAEELRRNLFAELRERRSQLNEELDNWNPLTLRRMEREEVMKTTLKWILGPDFDMMPNEIAQLYGSGAEVLATIEPSRLTPEQWAHVMERGEFIKFLHQAIEWENVVYFVYPYFWDHPSNHSLKRFLQHPDSIHQTFLRGGAARVVLTIRPEFQKKFAILVDKGFLDESLESGHPYLTIAEEIQNYAETNYPGIPGSNGGTEPTEEEIDVAGRGKRIATWYEYTPVSALDISINTPLSDLT